MRLKSLALVRSANTEIPARQNDGSLPKRTSEPPHLAVALVEHGIELGVVVHLHLAIKAETALAVHDLHPELVETGGEIVALLLEDTQTLTVAQAMGLRRRGAVRFFRCVKNFESEDGEPVDDKSRSLGVHGCGLILRAGFVEEEEVDLLDEVVAKLIEAVDLVLDVRDVGVRYVGTAGLVFLVPEIEVGAVLAQDQLGDDGMIVARRKSGGIVPLGGGGIVKMGDLDCVEHCAIKTVSGRGRFDDLEVLAWA